MRALGSVYKNCALIGQMSKSYVVTSISLVVRKTLDYITPHLYLSLS
jgi:hypothetical protein